MNKSRKFGIDTHYKIEENWRKKKKKKSFRNSNAEPASSIMLVYTVLYIELNHRYFSSAERQKRWMHAVSMSYFETHIEHITCDSALPIWILFANFSIRICGENYSIYIFVNVMNNLRKIVYALFKSEAYDFLIYALSKLRGNVKPFYQ